MPITYLGVKFNIPKPENFRSVIESALIYDADKTYYSSRDNLELFAWEKDPDLIPLDNWYNSDSISACMFGYGMDDNGSEKLNVQAFTTSKDYEKVWNKYHGEWSAVLMDDNSLIAGSSAIGTYHTYATDCPSFMAVSNRARILWVLLKACGESIELDWETLSALLSLGYPFCTTGTAVRQVKIVPSTQYVKIKTNFKRIEYYNLDHNFFMPKSANFNLSWAEMPNCLEHNLRWIENINTPIIASLTGGKDTRLILSLLKSKNLTEKIKFYIRAPEKHSDYLVASILAKQFELDFERIDRPLIENLFESLRYHVAFTEGLLNAWDIKPETDYKHAVFIHGLLGGIYKGKGISQATEINGVCQSILPKNSSILTFPVLEEQEKKVLFWLKEITARGIPLSFARDLFYLLQRVPRWTGQTILHDGLVGININPLYHPKVLRAFYQLSNEERKGERIHFETMIRLCHKMAYLPFAKKGWDSKMILRSTQCNIKDSENGIIRSEGIIGVGWQAFALRHNWKNVKCKIMDELSGLKFLVDEKKVPYLLDELRINVINKNSIINKSWKRARKKLRLQRISMTQKELIMKVMGLLTILTLKDELSAPGKFQVKLK